MYTEAERTLYIYICLRITFSTKIAPLFRPLPLPVKGYFPKVPQCHSVLKLQEKTTAPHLIAPPPSNPPVLKLSTVEQANPRL